MTLGVDELVELGGQYPPELCDPTLAGWPSLVLYNMREYAYRTAFDISIVADAIGTSGSVADIGGGFGLFSLGISHLGFTSYLVDDNYMLDLLPNGRDVEKMLLANGINILERDVLTDGLGLEPGSMDAITTFHTLEHFHHSPKAVAHQMVDALRPGGVFVIAVPNAVNLRKRIAVPMGKTNWSPMPAWYERPEFHGHVREFVVDDLRYMAKDLGLVDVKIVGRNFVGMMSRSWKRRQVGHLVDPILRPFPGLCSDLYLIGKTPT